MCGNNQGGKSSAQIIGLLSILPFIRMLYFINSSIMIFFSGCAYSLGYLKNLLNYQHNNTFLFVHRVGGIGYFGGGDVMRKDGNAKGGRYFHKTLNKKNPCEWVERKIVFCFIICELWWMNGTTILNTCRQIFQMNITYKCTAILKQYKTRIKT